MKKIVILSGAGISAESGIKTFRDHNGLWENHNIYEVASPEAFINSPQIVHKFYNQRRNQLLSSEVKVNEAHRALALVQDKLNITIVTQNVDDLHERAGSKKVLHMHGELLKIKCNQCDFKTHWEEDLSIKSQCPQCKSLGQLRPDIVWFGENIYHMEQIQSLLSECDIFIAIGTSGQVYPANQFAAWCRKEVQTIEVNLEPTEISSLFKEQFYGPASKIVPLVLDKIMNGKL